MNKSKKNVRDSEIKRIKLQGEDERKQQTKKVIDKKRKRQKVELTINSPMMVVASQK